MSQARKYLKSAAIIILILLLIVGLTTLYSRINLYKFTSVTAADPLFYDPSTNIAELESAVEKLKQLDDKILTVNRTAFTKSGEKNFNPYPAGWRLWPEEFLMELPVVHRKTEIFLNNPSPQNGELLLASYREAVSSYKKAISLHILALKKVVSQRLGIKNRKILFFGSATTPNIVLNDYILINKNADKLLEEIENRENCLRWGVCEDIDNYAPQNKKKGEMIAFKPLPDDILEIDKKKGNVFGPFWATTGCLGFTENNEPYNLPFFIAVKNSKFSGNSHLLPILTNNKYYRDYKYTPDAYSVSLYSKIGVKIWPHTVGDDYLCTDLRFLPDLYIQYLAKENGNFGRLSFESKLSTLPEIIKHTISFSDIPSNYIKYTKTARDPLDFLTTRTAYSLYFGTFSKAIWRLREEPQFLIKQDFSEFLNKSGYSTYQDLVKRGMSDADIRKLNDAPHIDQLLQKAVLEEGL